MQVVICVGVSGCGGSSSTATTSTPVATPTPAPEATVGAAGGTVTAPGGAATLVVPPGALATPVALTLRVSTRSVLDPHAVAGSSFELQPSVAFAVPATLTLRYDATRGPSGADPAELRVSLLAGDAWQPVAGGSADVGAGTASAAITTSGTYGVWWPGPARACSAAEDRQFDFWLGSWNFSAPGSLPGTNDITSEGGGCLIEEHFVDTSGTRGRSVSVRSSLDGQWHQTYVDSRGGRLVLVGTFDGRRMVLLENAGSRYVWETLDASTVRYAGEQSRDGGVTWTAGFDARYTRR